MGGLPLELWIFAASRASATRPFYKWLVTATDTSLAGIKVGRELDRIA